MAAATSTSASDGTTSEASSDSESQTMKAEVQAAAAWWTQQIRKKCLNLILVRRFQTALTKEIYTKLKKHWYPDQPARGSGYRSISFFHHLDPVLKRAGDHVGMHAPEKLLISAYEHVMFVNPGSVFIKKKGKLVEHVFPLESQPQKRSQVPNHVSPPTHKSTRRRTSDRGKRAEKTTRNRFSVSAYVQNGATNGSGEEHRHARDTRQSARNQRHKPHLDARAKPFGANSPPQKNLSASASVFQPKKASQAARPHTTSDSMRIPAEAQQSWGVDNTDRSSHPPDRGGISFIQNGSNQNKYNQYF